MTSTWGGEDCIANAGASPSLRDSSLDNDVAAVDGLVEAATDILFEEEPSCNEILAQASYLELIKDNHGDQFEQEDNDLIFELLDSLFLAEEDCK